MLQHEVQQHQNNDSQVQLHGGLSFEVGLLAPTLKFIAAVATCRRNWDLGASGYTGPCMRVLLSVQDCRCVCGSWQHSRRCQMLHAVSMSCLGNGLTADELDSADTRISVSRVNPPELPPLWH